MTLFIRFLLKTVKAVSHSPNLIMKIKNIFLVLVICNSLLISLNAQKQMTVIPRPKSFKFGAGYLDPKQIEIIQIKEKNPELRRMARLFAEILDQRSLPIKEMDQVNQTGKNYLNLTIKENIYKPNLYTLRISGSGIHIEASKEQGIFYALQTLTQMIEFAATSEETGKLKLPYIVLEDEPRFDYRGLHLDVSRHYFSVAFVKQYIDLLSRYKLNQFHWHLTDDQGWRIEIKKYPLLTQVGSVRKETLKGHYSDQPVQYDGKEHSGFYTQEEIKEIVQYAKDRYVNIIPEIEMPGHASAILSAYPIMGCTGGPYKVETTWGVFDDVICPKDTSISILKEILDEVCDLFPGPYIHIGGDECPKTRWAVCKHCEATKRKNGLKSDEELQSYLITQMDLYLSRKGKKLIGWDEILEGGLSPNATVMSWRGTDGGRQAAKLKHDVVMCPVSNCYFDYYQSTYPKEPMAIGGYLPLEKVYNFNPIPSDLDSASRKYIIGAQGNVWTEYMADEQKVLYMTYPRAMALAEANWTNPVNKSYAEFQKVLPYHMDWFAKQGIKLSNAYIDVNYVTEFSQEHQCPEINFKVPNLKGKILMETYANGDYIQQYIHSGKLLLDKSADYKFWFQMENKTLGRPSEVHFVDHKGSHAISTIEEKPASQYSEGGNYCILNGIDAPTKKYSGTEWLGFSGKDMSLKLDWKEPQELSQISLQTYHLPGAWIYAPASIQVLSSADGKNYTPVQELEITKPTNVYQLIELKLKEKLVSSHVRIVAKNYGLIPQAQPGSGHGAWLFIGEVRIN